jgi:intracellular sulfur oxidation DsrE/DsrF family protein
MQFSTSTEEISMKVVFHLDLDEEKVLRIALTNMENLRAAKPGARINLLVNGPAVKFFRKNGEDEFLTRIKNLIQSEVTVFVCQNALRAFEIPEEDLCPGCETVPAGVVALIKLQQQGCAYIKP